MTKYHHHEWIWYGEDEAGNAHVSLGRWGKHPCQMRYKMAEIQPTEHDHPVAANPAPSGDEYEVDYEVICDGEYVAGSSDLKEAKHYALVYSQDGPVEIIEAHTYRRPLPSESEGGE